MLTLPTPHVTSWLRLFALAILFVSANVSGVAQATPGFLPFIGNPFFSDSEVHNIVVQPDSKILSGRFSNVSGLPRANLARLDAKGNVDASFVPARARAFDFLLQPDGKIIINGEAGLERLNTDGSLDPTFTSPLVSNGSNAVGVYALALAADGKIYIGGQFDSVGGLTRHDVARLNPNGTVDSTFADIQTTWTQTPLNSPIVRDLAVQPDGKLLVAGNFDGISGSNRTAIARLNSDGTADGSFTDPGVPDTKYVIRILIQPDGKILLTGSLDISRPQRVYSSLVRLNADGSLDEAFVGPNPQIQSVCALQADYKPVCQGTGSFQTSGPVLRRLSGVDGSLDSSFNPVTTREGALAVAVQPDGKILVGGTFYPEAGVHPRTLVRLNPNGTVDKPLSTAFDYDGDLKADISIFRPSNGTWYIIRSGVGYSTMTWGVAGDRITPADFDGDAKTDLAVYRPSNGTWYLFNSADNTFGTLQWGEANDVPLAGDYNGDRKADFMIYRPSNGLWYLQSSIDFAKTIKPYGAIGDKPMIGDFDGDYVADYTVYRPSSTEWRPLTSFIGGIAGRSWGNVTDIRVPADYDGDGKTDIAIYRPSTGEWWILPSSQPPTTFYRIQWGIPGDEPVVADYDGDGKADRAVFRPSNNTWYIAGSSAGILVFPFGEAGDIPTQTVFP
jgi:uncharacterized delta-60 repeat protein